MSIETAGLYGSKFKDFKDVHFMFFSDDDFDRWFAMKESAVAEEIKSKLAILSERVKRIEQSKWFAMGIAAAIGFVFAQMEILKRFFS